MKKDVWFPGSAFVVGLNGCTLRLFTSMRHSKNGSSTRRGETKTTNCMGKMVTVLGGKTMYILVI